MNSLHVDVVVAGGGSAGVAAAIASAECGAKTLLIEKFSCLGGASTMRNVSTYCGLYTLGETPQLVVGGIAARVLAGLERRGAVTPPLRHRGVFVVFDPESVKVVLDELCEAAGVHVMLGAFVADATRDAQSVTAVTIADHSGLRTVTARAFVDCTGEGDLAAFCGAGTRYGNGEYVNLGTLGTRFGGIPPSVSVAATDIAQAVGRFREREASPSAPPAVTKDRSVVARLPISNDLVCYLASEDYDPRDALSMSDAERRGRRQAWQYLEILRTIPGCENAFLVSTGPEFGTRESRHIESLRALSWDDIAARRSFDDCVALGAWGAEWHDRGSYESSFDYAPDKGAYEIPLSCLTSQNTDNLYAAGRLADADRRAGAAIRVMGTAFATGQACGVAAALSASGDRNGTPRPNASAVREVLRQQHAILSL